MVAVTDKYRRVVEKRSRERRSVLLPMRVSVGGEVLFEGATLDVSGGGVHFRMPSGERLSPGARVRIEMSIPAELAGGNLGYRTMRQATVVRVENETLAYRVGCHPRTCGVALAFDPEVITSAARRSAPELTAVA
jgi:hypothetical protein